MSHITELTLECTTREFCLPEVTLPVEKYRIELKRAYHERKSLNGVYALTEGAGLCRLELWGRQRQSDDESLASILGNYQYDGTTFVFSFAGVSMQGVIIEDFVVEETCDSDVRNVYICFTGEYRRRAI